MKKILLASVLATGISLVHAQDSTTKVKKTSTPVQKVHNTFSKHKEYSGYKVKHTDSNGKSTMKVDTAK
jgi:hypothetical protein